MRHFIAFVVAMMIGLFIVGVIYAIEFVSMKLDALPS